MSLTLTDELRARQIAAGMQVAVAASAAAKTTRDSAPSKFERTACTNVAEMLRSVARGEAFLREPAKSLGSTSLSDFQVLTTVEAALRHWFGKQPTLSTPVATFLSRYAHELDRLGAGSTTGEAEGIAEFLRFLNDGLSESISSLTAFKAPEVIGGSLE